MTERLYYTDSFLREFDARVLSCTAAGDRFHVLLDRTAFYPASGGQPSDTGTLGEARVLDVMDRDDGGVVHLTDRLLAAGPIRGAIDWDRRFDHMQQHTGQHLLSAAFVDLFGFATVSFHLGAEASTIDLAAPSVVPRHLEEAERLTNRVIFEDRPVTVRFPAAAELAAMTLRKKPDREGPLRVIDIAGFDLQACGGTHLARTGQAGMILLRKCERQKGNWRVEFVCGFRALAAARRDFALLNEAAAEFTSGRAEVPALVRKTLAETAARMRAVKHLLDRTAELHAAQLLAAPPLASPRVIALALDAAEPGYVALLAAKLAAAGGVQAVVVDRATRQVVLAQSAGLAANLGDLLRELFAEFPGKGGGSRVTAQGSLADATQVDAFLARARERLARS